MTDFWLSWLLLCSLFMFSVTLALMSPFPSGWPFLHGTLYRPDKYMVHPNEYVFCLINQRHLCDRQHYKKQKKQRVCMIKVMVFTLSSIRKPPSQASKWQTTFKTIIRSLMYCIRKPPTKWTLSNNNYKNSIPLEVPLESIPSINRLIISFMPLECYVVGEKRDNTISLRYKRLKDLHGWLVYNVVFLGLRRMVEEGRKDFHVWKIKVKSCQVERERERETRDHDQARCLSSRPAADIVPDIVFDV